MLLYVNDNIIGCLIKVTGSLEDTREISREEGRIGTVGNRKSTETSKRERFYSVKTLTSIGKSKKKKWIIIRDIKRGTESHGIIK